MGYDSQGLPSWNDVYKKDERGPRFVVNHLNKPKNEEIEDKNGPDDVKIAEISSADKPNSLERYVSESDDKQDAKPEIQKVNESIKSDYKEILENFIKPSQISPEIIKRFMQYDTEIRELKEIVKNCNSVLAGVKDFNPDEVIKSVEDVEKRAKEEVEAMKNRFK